MQFSQFLLILKARYRIILATFLLVLLSGLAISLLMPNVYKATTTLILNYKGIDPVTGVSLPAQLMPGYMATQVDIITSHKVATKVVDALGLAANPQAQEQFRKANSNGDIRDWYADLLLNKVDAKPSRESSVIELTFEGPDPQFSAEAANAFAAAYQEASLQVKTEPSQKAASYLSQQTQVLKRDLEEAQNKLIKYQQENGITSGIEQLDMENSKLSELTQQLVYAQGQSIETTSRNNTAQNNYANSPEVAQSALVQNLKFEVSKGESELALASERFGTSHPQYESSRAKLDKLKAQLNEATRSAVSVVGGSARINHQREAELRAQVAQQKTKVLALNGLRNQLGRLQKDVDNAQRSLDTVSLRYTQTNLEGQGSQTDIAVLNTALPPEKPASPKLFLNMILATFLGTLLGIGFALIAEMLDKRVRSIEDLQSYVDLPVIGVIGGPVKTKSNVPLLTNLAKS